MATIALNSDNFEAEVKNASGTILVDFYADWCGPCKMQGPIVEELSDEMTDVKFCKLNVDEAVDIAQEYAVMSIPTLMVVKDGEVTYKEPGLLQKDQIKQLIG